MDPITEAGAQAMLRHVTRVPRAAKTHVVYGGPRGALMEIFCDQCPRGFDKPPPPRVRMKREILALDGPCGRVEQHFFFGRCEVCGCRHVSPIETRTRDWTEGDIALRDDMGKTAAMLKSLVDDTGVPHPSL